jgi:hypothetical protein
MIFENLLQIDEPSIAGTTVALEEGTFTALHS